MVIPYYNPNLRILDVIKACLINKTKAENRIKSYFSELTGKRFILLTNSCRTALYLAYQSIEKNGEVITSPLTCKVAIDPIEKAGNTPVFADILPGNLNINPLDIEKRITDKTIAIQPIHLGGVSCDIGCIIQIAERYKLKVIEDCAQSLGANYKGKATGSFGDVACFSLIKNGYGIGGGILATNSEKIFKAASTIKNKYKNSSKIITGYRIIRNILESKRKYLIGSVLYNALICIKGNTKNYTTIMGQLKKISPMTIKIAAYQITRFNILHELRKAQGSKYFAMLNSMGAQINNNFRKEDSSFTKYFLYNPKINSQEMINILKNKHIEAMHLEHAQGSPYQARLLSKDVAAKLGLLNYNKIHDSIISLPLTEDMSNDDLISVTETITNLLNEK